MASRPRSRNARVHPYLHPFLRDCAAYHREIVELLTDEDGAPTRRERTVTALLLKACFLKLAKERHFLVVDGPLMFADLMKLGRRRARPTNQIDMWREDRVRLAIDTLLEGLDLDSRVIHKARLAGLYARLHNFRLEILDRDILGQVYQAVTARSVRKAGGQYYTPPALVDRLLDDLDLDPIRNPELRVCDPACGSGQILLGAYARLKARYLAAGMDRESAHRRILETHLYGFDIDPFALTLTRMNLFLQEHIQDPVNFHVYQVNPLKRDEHDLFLAAQKTPATAGFDVVLGNPPWGLALSQNDKRLFRATYHSAVSGVNSFTLFLERGIELLRPGGRLGFLIPDAYLNIRAHESSREWLLKTAAIERIRSLGERFDGVFAPSILLVARREPDAARRLASPVRVSRDAENGDDPEGVIVQRRFAATPEHIFNIHLDDDRVRDLLGRLATGCATLKGHAHFGLGIVTGDNDRLVSDAPLTPLHEPLIVGKDIEPFRIAPSSRWLVYCRDSLQQACPREVFDAPQKLVYRFIGRRLVVACDEQGRLTLNNANVLVPALPGFRVKYVLALLNSTVIQFVYTFTFFTLKVLRGNLERLPLKYAPDARQRRIEGLVDALAEAGDEAVAALRAEIDREIFDIYGVSDEDAAFMARRLEDDERESRA